MLQRSITQEKSPESPKDSPEKLIYPLDDQSLTGSNRKNRQNAFNLSAC